MQILGHIFYAAPVLEAKGQSRLGPPEGGTESVSAPAPARPQGLSYLAITR